MVHNCGVVQKHLTALFFLPLVLHVFLSPQLNLLHVSETWLAFSVTNLNSARTVEDFIQKIGRYLSMTYRLLSIPLNPSKFRREIFIIEQIAKLNNINMDKVTNSYTRAH